MSKISRCEYSVLAENSKMQNVDKYASFVQERKRTDRQIER